MTTYNHTAIPYGAAADTTVLNPRLADLDAAMGNVATLALEGSSIVAGIGTAALTTTAQNLVGAINEVYASASSAAVTAEVIAARDAYPNLDARLDAMQVAGGNVSTLTNGAANAGQKDVTVDSTDGFLVGAPVTYTLVGGAVETNTIANITPTTVLTMVTNIGTGGIGDNTFIIVIAPGTLISTGAVRGATATSQLFETGAVLGTNAPSADDSALLIARAATNPLAAGGSHGVRDESTYISATEGGYASYDSIPVTSGATAYNHVASFQSRPTFSGSTTIGAIWGFTFSPTLTDGTADYVLGLRVYDATLSGDAAINLQAALWADELTSGTANYVIYSNGATPSYHGGLFQVGNIINSTNLYDIADYQFTTVGVGAGRTGFYDLFVGHDAGHSATNDTQHCTFVGNQAGYSDTSGEFNTYVGSGAGYTAATVNGNVFVGYNAGYYETAGNKLFIDNAPRASEADARTKALIYGVFDAAVANQALTFNAGKMGFFGTAAVAKPTGVAVSDAAIHAALVTLGLIAA